MYVRADRQKERRIGMSEDFFNDLGKKITRAANEAVDKGTEFFEVTKIRAQIAGEGKAIEKHYRDIGEIVYKLQQEGTPVSEEVAKICDEILAHEKLIKTMRSEMASLKGMKLCPNCEEMVDKTAAFCPKCGSSIVVEETVEKEDIVEDVENVAEEVVSEAEEAAEEVKETVSDVKEAAEDIIEDVVE